VGGILLAGVMGTNMKKRKSTAPIKNRAASRAPAGGAGSFAGYRSSEIRGGQLSVNDEA